MCWGISARPATAVCYNWPAAGAKGLGMAKTILTAGGAGAGVARAKRGLGTVLTYVRQSKSDYNPDGSVRGPSLNQQLDSVLRVPALKGLNYEHFSDANLRGKETSSRPGHNAMMTRLRTAAPG